VLPLAVVLAINIIISHIFSQLVHPFGPILTIQLQTSRN